MFKKIMLLALVFSALCIPAFAAGKLTVNQEKMAAYDSYGSVGVDVYAELENTGDSNVEFSAGLVELFDAEGNTIDSTDYVYCYPSVLGPGEKGYVVVNMYPENANAAADIASYTLTVSGKDTAEEPSILRSEGVYQAEVSEDYWTYDYIVSEIFNETDAPVFDVYCAYAVKDANGELQYCAFNLAYTIGIPAGGSTMMRLSMPEYRLAAFAAEGIVPETVETVAYLDNY